DGIRDYKVTGVQTCALPLCLECHDLRPDVTVQAGEPGGVALRDAQRGLQSRATGDGEAELRVVGAGCDELVRVRLDARGDAHERAEERRVGCEGGWRRVCVK